MSRVNLLVKKRLLFILVTFTFLIFLLLIRIGYIQLVQGEQLRKDAYIQQNMGRVINPKRGTIYDRNGKELAISASVETVSVNPQDLRKNTVEPEYIAKKLAEILEMDQNKVLTIISRNTIFEFVKQKVDKEVGDAVRRWREEEELIGIYVDEDSKRFYPNESLASHVIGITRIDNVGMFGIEAVFDKYLQGVPGKIISEVDGLGREIPLSEEKYISPRDGWNVILTIDETIQYFAEKALENAMADYKLIGGAAAIVMDPRTGEILAMASLPDFDLNNPRLAPPGYDTETWSGYSNEDVNALWATVWKNKAISEAYEPGSTFKAITTAAGIEEGVITPDTIVTDKTITMGGHDIKCWKPNAHGTQPFYMGVYNSCNPVFVNLSLDLGVSRFYSYMKSFGFYDDTNIELPEGKPVHHEKPKEIDMAVASFGQRFMITPIQLATAYSAIANGGKLLKPHLVKELIDNDGNIVERYEPEVVRNVISRQTSETVREILEGVVSIGTGKNAYVKGYRVAGKTGTSVTTVPGRYIASFAAIAPADNPVITVLIVLDHPMGFSYYGGTIAAPVAGQLVEDTLNYLGVERRYTEQDQQMMKTPVTVPDLRNMTVEQAKQALKNSKLKAVVKDDGSGGNLVKDQTPKPGASLYEDSVVIVYSYNPPDDRTVSVPDLSNKTISEATETLNSLGLNIKVNGVGMAHKQSIEPGARVEEGKIIEVDFLYFENTVW